MGAIIICDRVCDDCKMRLYKDPLKGGDYTIHGQLLSTCPKCGLMYPELEKLPTENLSNERKRLTGVRVSAKYDLDFGQMKMVISDISECDLFKFIARFREKIEETFGLKLQFKDIHDFV